MNAKFGNDRQIQADRIQENQYQLSDDIGSQVAPPIVIKWPPDLWEILTVKYMSNDATRSRLGALALLAGYEV
uniref:Uncharacterized protein n=1 Tax=viral metagenome TaxID=1070528 RepID=A0A6H2A7A7_9ZZZZ